jgi:hypothetical protein
MRQELLYENNLLRDERSSTDWPWSRALQAEHFFLNVSGPTVFKGYGELARADSGSAKFAGNSLFALCNRGRFPSMMVGKLFRTSFRVALTRQQQVEKFTWLQAKGSSSSAPAVRRWCRSRTAT